jgi:toxin FitB
MAWLLDTNILSELRRPKPEQKVVAFVAGCALDQLYISAVTLAKIRFGIELVGEPNRRADLNDGTATSRSRDRENRSGICGARS